MYLPLLKGSIVRGMLIEMESVVLHMQVVWTSSAIVATKKHG